jgi:uncharacterized protein
MQILTYPFSKEGQAMLSSSKGCHDWPVVYLINNDKELYIGETQNAYVRFGQHLENAERKNLKQLHVILDEEFNKSAVLDIEQSLIQLCMAESKFRLQNHNGGQSCKHDYYQRERYLNKLDEIWDRLRSKKLCDATLEEIRNKDIFRYSPYNSLTEEQNQVCFNVIGHMIKTLKEGKRGCAVINGGAGTGKTIVLISMLFKLVSACDFDVDDSDEDWEVSEYLRIKKLIANYVRGINLGQECIHSGLKVGYVCPMTSLKNTMKKVFEATGRGLKGTMVLKPFEVANNGGYDVVFVDEAHRLTRRKNITAFLAFDSRVKEIGLDPNCASALDVIVAHSKYQVLVYDPEQSVKGSDLTNEQFEMAISEEDVIRRSLKTQMRCSGGQAYTDYLKAIFSCSASSYKKIEDYEFRLFDDVDVMINAIKELDKKYGLCRNAAGYAWEWVSKKGAEKAKKAGIKGKKKVFDYILRHGLADIHISGHDYVWNMTSEEFILSENAVNEIGCIHTLQGYDLNYVGVILGKEIDYDPKDNRITIDRNEFYDKKVKNGVDKETLKGYIVNSYRVMMSRGIKGCFVYACNPRMKKYLERFISK